MIARSSVTTCAILAAIFITPATAENRIDPSSKLPREKIDLVAPPFAPAHEKATKAGPKILEVTLAVEEKQIVIDEEGTKLQAMTFNGSIPALLIVAHEGDYVEVTLVNPKTNSMAHNIDFHAATGALGGGDLTLISPGEQTVLRWKATRTGVFVYHCIPGGVMIPWHVASGMSGAVLPGRRALANYALHETRAGGIDKVPQPIGSFGANENGLLDIAGNVWEWTQSCYVRIVLDAQGDVARRRSIAAFASPRGVIAPT
jgi:uncharacterized cupredoxin-like copper-binding protein